MTVAGVARSVRSIVARAQLGDALDDVDFFAIGLFADTRLRDLTRIVALLEPGRGAKTFYLVDAFDAELGPARNAYRVADDALRAARDRFVAELGSRIGFVPTGEEFILMRSARVEIPAGARIVRETSEYFTLTIELDDETSACRRDRDAAFAAVAIAEARARRSLAEHLIRHSSDIFAALGSAGRADASFGEAS